MATGFCIVADRDWPLDEVGTLWKGGGSPSQRPRHITCDFLVKQDFNPPPSELMKIPLRPSISVIATLVIVPWNLGSGQVGAVENFPAPDSLAAETGSAVGRAQPLDLERDFVQAPAAPPVPEVQIPSVNTYEVIAASEDFTTFVAAIRAAGLEDTFSASGFFTVIAPNNAAFQALLPGVWVDLMRPANRAALRSILTYHLIPGRLLSTDLRPGAFRTMQGSPVSIMGGVEGVFTVQGATIVQADVLASNGVIHAVDRVLIPPNVNIANYGLGAVR